MKKKIISLIKNNPVFGLFLGLCPTLAISNTFESAFIMGFSVLIILICSNFTISIVSRFIPKNVMIPCYIMIIATFVTVLEMLLSHYFSSLYDIFNIYISLIVVNCIILGRAIEVASNGKIFESLKDALKMGFGFSIAISSLGLIREILGKGTITIINQTSDFLEFKLIFKVLDTKYLCPNSFFISPAGAFIVLAFVLAFVNYLKEKGDLR